MKDKEPECENADDIGDEELAPRWLSGGKTVALKDNPTALAYTRFIDRVASVFLREQRDHKRKR